jgi:hypothetical protein
MLVSYCVGVVTMLSLDALVELPAPPLLVPVSPLDVSPLVALPAPEFEVPVSPLEAVPAPVSEVPVPPVALVPLPLVAPVSVPLVPVPLVSVPVPVPPVPVSVPAVPVVVLGVEMDGFTSASAAALLLSMLAELLPLPVPLALADVPSPSLLAVASPSANASLPAVRPLVSTDPSEPASIAADDEAEPSPVELADKSICAEEEAEAAPSSPVLSIEPEVSTVTAPVIEPLPVVVTSVSPSAVDSETAEVASELLVEAPSPNACPTAEPSPVDVPSTLADADVLPSSLVVAAEAAPEADASVPVVTRLAFAVTPPSLSKCASVLLSAVELSVAVSLPVAPACVEDEESAVLPFASSLWPLALPFADEAAPAPSALASECDDELVAPPPDVEWLSECPLADAAQAAIGAADSISAKALVDTTRAHFNRALLMDPPKYLNRVLLRHLC